MKSDKIKLAIQLRSEGMSARSIAERLSCSRSSVTRWIQDMPLDDLIIQKIKNSNDKIRAKAANHPNSPRNKWKRYRDTIMINNEREIPEEISKETLKLTGIALYWAEGKKAGRSAVAFSNADPLMTKIMMRFFREVCNIKEDRFRGELNIHPHLDIKKAELFWSDITKIPLTQFYSGQCPGHARGRFRSTRPPHKEGRASGDPKDRPLTKLRKYLVEQV